MVDTSRPPGEPTRIEPPRRPGAFVSLRQRDFRLLWISTMAAGFGQWGQQIAMNWLVFVLTGSALQLGGVAFAGGILSLVLMPFGGLLADRYPRRTIIVVTTLIGAAQSFAIAALVFTDLVQVWHVYAFALISAVTRAANQPARQAYVHDVSSDETLGNAIALNSIAQNLSRVMGPPLAGVLAATAVGAPFAFVAAMHSVGSIATIAMSRRPQERVGRGNPLGELAAGFAYLFRHPRLRLLVAVNGLPALLVYPYVSFMPIFVEDVLGGGARAYGVLVSMIGVGSVVGLFLLAYLGNLRRRGAVVLGFEMIYLSLVLTFTQTGLFVAALAILATAGVFHGFALALNNTVFQTTLRGDMRGRGMAVWQMASSVSPLGALPMGFLVSRIGIQSGVAVHVGICLALFVLIAVFGRSVREA